MNSRDDFKEDIISYVDTITFPFTDKRAITHKCLTLVLEKQSYSGILWDGSGITATYPIYEQNNYGDAVRKNVWEITTWGDCDEPEITCKSQEQAIDIMLDMAECWQREQNEL